MTDVFQRSMQAQIPSGHIRVHYYRPDGDYTSWTLYAFGDTTENQGDYYDGPVSVAGLDIYGAYFDVGVISDAHDVGLIIHDPSHPGGDLKDPGPDMHLNAAVFTEAWVISGDSTLYVSQPSPAQILSGGFSRVQSYWINRNTVAVPARYVQPNWTFSLVYSLAANLEITSTFGLTGGTNIALVPDPIGLSVAEQIQFPQLAGYAVFHLASGIDLLTVETALKSQLAVAAFDASSMLRYITGVQHAGVLDDLFYYAGGLGAVFQGKAGIDISVWAPTAQKVRLLLFVGETDTSPALAVHMTEMEGVWTARVDECWRGKYYLFATTVYVPSLHAITENFVTDPYSVDLALNGVKTRITDLADDATKPEGWDDSLSPYLRSKNDLSIYELHVRDFSVFDESVPGEQRGTYLAFTNPNTDGIRHLRELAEVGLKAVHLLPTFHIASINEDRATWQTTPDLSGYPPDSEQQQAAVAAIQNTDAYNWGYDPVHYLAPEGAYAVRPEHRVKEYRQMVMGLHNAGLRVIQDVVFNHTSASGQAANSVLDKIVPGYYYRLDADGNVYNSSCCADTASEHRMFEKLMIDTVVMNARQYKIDGFRFDLMSFHFVANIQNIQQPVAQLTLEKNGVDGSLIYLYGEGWEIGETANNALGPNASQVNMFGTGVGTFNDRIRDGIRGGGAFGDQRLQGWATGLFTDPNTYTEETVAAQDQLSDLLARSDWIRAGLAGNLKDFRFIDRTGVQVVAGDVSYFQQGAGYTATPLECVNYNSVHDNQTLFDAIQLKSASGDSIDMRTRRQILAMSIVALSQGIPLFQGGDDLLRSKDMDDNSYNSGDWFNKLDFTYQSNNWGTGLPVASQNQSNWPNMQPLLADLALRPATAHIALSRLAFREFLAIRESSALFRMTTLEEVQRNLSFLNTGPQQIPGLICMLLSSNNDDYGPYDRILVLFNATISNITFTNVLLKGLGMSLIGTQAKSCDPLVRQSSFDSLTGTASVPGLTTAVFVAER